MDNFKATNEAKKKFIKGYNYFPQSFNTSVSF